MGRWAARNLLGAGHRVTVLSRGWRDPVEGAAMLTADRRDMGGLAAALRDRRFDLTVDFLAYDDTDVERLATVPATALGRYVMISTGQVYLVGEGARPPFREEDAERPVRAEPPGGTRDHANWSYGVGKRRAEQALRGLRETNGLRGIALRLPTVQGEGDGSLRLWAYLERMLDGGRLVLPDGGERPTRFLYAGDLARALVRLAESPAPTGTVYNLAGPEIIRLREFLGRVAQAAGLEPRFVDAPWEECRAAGLDENFSPYAGAWNSILDPCRAVEEWGFLGTRVDEYLPLVVRWHLEHRPATSDTGYAQRASELALAARLAGVQR